MLALLLAALAFAAVAKCGPEACDKGKAARYLKSFYSLYPALERLSVPTNLHFIVGCRATPQRGYVLINPGSYSLKVVSVVRDAREALLKVEDESFEMPELTAEWCRLSIIDAIYLLFPEDFVNKEFRISEKETELKLEMNTRAKKIGICTAVMRQKGGPIVYQMTLGINIVHKCMNIDLAYERQAPGRIEAREARETRATVQ